MVELVNYSPKHIDRLAHLLNNRKISDWITTIPYPYTKKDAEDWINLCIGSQGDPDDRNFLIEKEGELIGGIGITRTNSVAAMTGYWLAEEHWGKGYASEALKKIIDIGFNEMKLSRIFAYVYEGNIPSAKLLLKNGFEYEGLLKRAEVKNGSILNLELYAKTI